MIYVSCATSLCLLVFFFRQKTAYEVRISDWISDVCSSDLAIELGLVDPRNRDPVHQRVRPRSAQAEAIDRLQRHLPIGTGRAHRHAQTVNRGLFDRGATPCLAALRAPDFHAMGARRPATEIRAIGSAHV